MRADLNLISAIAAELAPYRDDEDAYLDTLDGETDVLDILDAEIAGLRDDEALAEAIKTQETELRARRSRIEMRAKAHKRNLRLLLSHAGLKKAERPVATVSLRPGSMSVRIVNETDIPTQLMRERITRSPDMIAIKAQIEAGVDVPGAEMTRGEDTISVRVS